MHEPGNAVLFLQYLYVLYLASRISRGTSVNALFIALACQLDVVQCVFLLFSSMFLSAFTDFPKI
jgi:hypothetical protein